MPHQGDGSCARRANRRILIHCRQSCEAAVDRTRVLLWLEATEETRGDRVYLGTAWSKRNGLEIHRSETAP